MTISLLGIPFAALLDTGAGVSLIGDVIFELCKVRKVTLRSSNTLLQLASGTSIKSAGAVRLRISFNGKTRRQRFLYLPRLAVPIILGRDFISRESISLDFAAGGYRLDNQPHITPFTRREDCITGATLPAHYTARPTAALPTSIRDALNACPATALQKQQLESILHPFATMFTETPGKTDVLLHRIETGNVRPLRCNPRPLSVHKRALLDAALQEMLDTGAVQQSQSPWASPVVLAPKKDGSVRLCVDYRRLNAVTVRDSYPFPSIDSIMYAIGNAKVFTTLDCSRGFLQIEIDPADVPKTAFTCHRGLFEFTRLPFGLSNSPASFQRLMDIVLGDTKYQFAIAYMDDVVVFSQTFEEHLEHLRIVLERLRAAGLTVHPRKVQLASPQINLLGFMVDNGVLRPNEDKLRAIADYPQPHDVKSLQRFLGLIGFHRQFIPRCAELANPLTLLLRKGEKWRWGEEQRDAFLRLSKAITDAASLQLPDLNRPFVVQTDASNSGLGAVLLQEHDGVLRPVAFASRTLTAAERNYSVTEKECLAIIFALKKFNMYLDGASFQIQTDHQALSWLKNLQNPAGRLARWALTLQAYDYSIAYRKGATNVVADALSRAPLQVLPTETEPKFVGLTDIVADTSESRWGTLVSRADLHKAQQEDGLCRRVCERLAARGASSTGGDDEYDSYLLSEDGLLLRYIPQADDDTDGSPFRILIPRRLRKSFIRYFHDSALAGHSSGSKTYDKLCRVATWPGIRQDVLKYARSCPVCQKAKPRGGQPPGLMQPVVSQSPWQIVACDVMGPFPRSPRGNQYLLVVTDHFTKWVELFPLRKLLSQRIWESLLSVFTRFGFPAELITDGASYFRSKIFVDTCAALGIRHKLTSPYHPQANITERVNRNLKMMLISHTARHKDWDAKLDEMAFATRTTINRSTGFTPARLNFGKELTFPMENTFSYTDVAQNGRPYAQFAQDVHHRLLSAVHEARETLDVARLQQAAQYDKGRRDVQFQVGDLVLRRTHPLSNASKGFAASLANRWDGPFRITEKVSPLSYRLARLHGTQQYGPIHVSDLKRYFEPAVVSQAPDNPAPSQPLVYGVPPRRYNLRRR